MCDLAIFLPNIFVTFLQCDAKLLGGGVNLWVGNEASFGAREVQCTPERLPGCTSTSTCMLGRSISLQYFVWIDSCSHVCMLKNIHDHCFSSDFQHRPILRGCDRGGHCWVLPSGQTDCPLLGNTTWYYLETPTHWPEKN